MAAAVSDHSGCVCYPWVSAPPPTPPSPAPGADRGSGEGQVPPAADDEGLLSGHLSGWKAKVQPGWSPSNGSTALLNDVVR